ncbi:MAG: molybdopterin-binding protein [Vicinamibacterales bacterium]
MNGPPVAAVLAVGSELLTLGRTDTNSPYIAARLHAEGLRVAYTAVVTDERDDLSEALVHALTRASLVVCTGGLGPTDDDRTRDVAAAVLGLSMREDGAVLDAIRERFSRRGVPMPAINRRQAQVPDGATVLRNERGTAPGLWIPAGEKAVVLMPGPPREMAPILARLIESHVRPRFGGGLRDQRVLVIAGRSESWVDEQAQPLYLAWRDRPVRITTTILATLGVVELHLSAAGADAPALAAALDDAQSALVNRFGGDVVNTDGRSLEATVGAMLADRGWTMAAAESCTGGLVTVRLTDVAGASAWVDRAVVSYSNAARIDLLGVSPLRSSRLTAP